MTGIRQLTEAWTEWVRLAPDAALDAITHVQLNQKEGGYDVHIMAWHADQRTVNRLAKALGCPTDKGWEPDNPHTKRQWAIDTVRDGIQWHLTATQDPDETQAPA